MLKTFRFCKGIEIQFRQWSNKNYAVFRSLKKTIKICTLAIGYSIITLPEPVFAQVEPDSPKDTVYNLDCVIVSARRTPTVYSEAARVVEVINQDEIRACPAQNLNELLENALSVDVRQRGVHGVQADISIRGGTFDQVLILLNGIPVSDPQTGHHNLNLPVDLENITRIEILEGSGSRIFGPNAFSGAINIITKDQGKDFVRGGVSYGQYNLLNGNASVNYSLGKFSQLLSVGYKSSSGYTENTDFSSKNAYYQASLKTKKSEFDLQAGYLNKGFGANSFYSAKFPNQYEQFKTKFASLTYQTGKKLVFSAGTYFRRGHDRFELFREDNYKYTNGYFVTENGDTAQFVPGYYYGGHNYHRTDIKGAFSKLMYVTKIGKSEIGIDYRYEEILSNVLGNISYALPIHVKGEDRGYFYTGATRKQFNIFAEHSHYYKGFSFSGGMLMNYCNEFGAHNYFGAEAGYDIWKKIKIYGSVNQSLRFPTFTDLYYSGPSNFGNDELNPERALGIEAGLKQVWEHHSWNISYYHRNGKDVIDWVKKPSETKYTTTNYSETTSKGYELSYKRYFNNKYISSFTVNYSYSETSNDRNDSLISAYVLDYLKHKFVVSGNFKLTDKFKLNLNCNYQDRNGSFTGSDGLENDYLPFFLVGAKLIFTHKSCIFSVEATNILNKNYRDIGFVQMPGRWIVFGFYIDYQLHRKK